MWRLHFHLQTPRFLFEAADGKLMRKTWFDAELIDDELAVRDTNSTEYLTAVVVLFAEASNPGDISGDLKYSERWTDEKSGSTFPGTCQLALRVPNRVLDFLDRASDLFSRGMNLYLSVDVAAGHPEFTRIGDEFQWESGARNPLPATVQSIGYAPPQTRRGEA